MSSKARSSEPADYVEFARALARRSSDRGLAERGFAVLRCPLSTHLLGRRIANEYSQESARPPKTDLLAWQQSAGHGREQRPWSSPPGGIYATLIRSLASDVGLQTLPLLVATALCEVLNAELAGRCRLKWPNDLLVGGRKLGGILIDVASRGAVSHATPRETATLSSSLGTMPRSSPSGALSDASSSAAASGLAVISFGVNHGDLDLAGVTSLEREAPGRTRLADVAIDLIEAVDDALERRLPVADVVARYRQLSLHTPGDALRCRVLGDEVQGIFQGFDRNGFLRLLVDGEERLLTAGEIANHG